MLSVKVLTNTGDFEPGGIYWSLPVDHMGYYTIHNPKTKTNWSLREEDIVIVNSSINDNHSQLSDVGHAFSQTVENPKNQQAQTLRDIFGMDVKSLSIEFK